jgi:hypothetical protein
MSESAPPEKRVRSKFTPTVKVWCDEIVVKDEEGNEYYPHAGEWVKFKTSVTIEVANMLGEIQQVQGLDPEKNQKEILGIGNRMVDVLLGQIMDWSLTADEQDEDGEYPPLPHPRRDREGARKALLKAGNHLLIFLQQHMMDGAANPPTSNLPSPST